MTDLPGHEGTVTADKKMTCNSYQRYKGGNRYYCSNVSAIFETISKFLTVLVRLVLEKVGVDRFTGPQREIYIRYEFGLKAQMGIKRV